MKSYRLLYIFTLFVMVLLTGCRDDELPYDIIGEGESSVSVEVNFEPIAINVDSRTSGDAISEIKDLYVVVYDAHDNFINLFSQTDLKEYNYIKPSNNGSNTEMPKDESGESIGEQAEPKTATATFKLPPLPFGRYKFYAVANAGTLTEDDVKDINALKNRQLTWDPDNVAANGQMFGYFTKTKSDNGAADGFDASVITLSRKSESIHAWIKRAASKVTIAFNPSGLNQSVWIYIHDVSIRDIPLHCALGADSKVEISEDDYGYNRDELLNHYNTPLSELPASAKILYDNNGELADPSKDTNQDFSNKNITKEEYTKWLTLANGSGIKGSDHSATANALYFYENMQGNYAENKEHDKTVTPEDIDGTCSTKPGDPDFKNGVICGTYIEVTAYYVSENPENVSKGKIKYRFMLGKDDTYSFNAQRNHHYKLTLGFNGWANQPLWNIEYYEQEPGIYLPDDFEVSYLYNQKHMLPIKIVGECNDLTVEIVENNWAPYDPTQPDEVPPAPTPTGDMYRFQWNRAAWSDENHTYKYRQKILQPEDKADNATFFGFLALAVPVNEELPDKTIIDEEYNNGVRLQTDLKNYYDTNGGVKSWNTGSQGIRKFDKDQLDPEGGINNDGTPRTDGAYYPGHNGWQVTKIDELSKMLHIPLITRNKSMILNSGFSGNNPYESFKRKAVIRVTATFPKQGGGTTTIVKQVPVFQTERIVNPKGVWRRYDDTDPFDVKLMKVIEEGANMNPGQTYFTTFTSSGPWKAYIEAKSDGAEFLKLNNQNDTVFGDTDTPIEFTLNFFGVDEKTSDCAVVRVDYNGYNCVHKIMVRQGYMAPIELGGTKWSSFSVYSCSDNSDISGTHQNIKVDLTCNPLALGTFFKYHNTKQGIRILNNNYRGPLVAVNGYPFQLTDGTTAIWANVDVKVPTITNNNVTDQTSWGTFISDEGRKYTLPSYDDYKYLENNMEFGFGVLYSDGTTSTATTWEGAYGYQAPNNSPNGPDTGKGARGVIVYDRYKADQIFFPVGKNGMGRRTQFNTKRTINGKADSNYNGELRYADVSYVLSGDGDYFRPVPYNLPIAPGAIYWIDVVQNKGYANTYPTAGWDMNYFNFDFNSYPDNGDSRFKDARPIKLVVTN